MKNIKSQIESLLFISAKPITIKQIAELVGETEEKVKEASDQLEEEYKNDQRGVQIIKNGSKYQMVSSPDNAKIVQDFIKDETTGELSRPSLETLTIIAYRGPICKTDLDRIRGVNCSLIIRNLMIRGLVEAKSGKNDETFYNVTFDFIRFLGINDINELPEYERLKKIDTIDKILAEDAANQVKNNNLGSEEPALSREEKVSE